MPTTCAASAPCTLTSSVRQPIRNQQSITHPTHAQSQKWHWKPLSVALGLCLLSQHTHFEPMRKVITNQSSSVRGVPCVLQETIPAQMEHASIRYARVCQPHGHHGSACLCKRQFQPKAQNVCRRQSGCKRPERPRGWPRALSAGFEQKVTHPKHADITSAP